MVEGAAAARASDLHLKPGRVPAIRVDGQMRALESSLPELEPAQTEAWIRGLLSGEAFRKLEEQWESDFSHEQETENGLIRLRVNVHRQRSGWGLVMRLLAERIPDFGEITLETSVQQLITLPRGLVLLTGPTGSGKTTTLASMMNALNFESTRHLYTIEDPIEYVYSGGRSEVTQREVGKHTHGFAQALRSALRADPDVILVGEMRDLDTIRLALTASETGHLVFSTLHTCDTAQTVERIIDVFPASQQDLVRAQLANVLSGVVTQSLLPRADCGGRIAVREILLANAAVRTLIREAKTHQLYGTLGSSVGIGMCPLELSLAYYVRKGLLEPGIAEREANRPAVLRSYLEASRLPVPGEG